MTFSSEKFRCKNKTFNKTSSPHPKHPHQSVLFNLLCKVLRNTFRVTSLIQYSFEALEGEQHFYATIYIFPPRAIQPLLPPTTLLGEESIRFFSVRESTRGTRSYTFFADFSNAKRTISCEK